MSGYADDVVAHSGILAEGTVLIQKPFTKRTLLTRCGSVSTRDSSIYSSRYPRCARTK
jgi:hypothetical protein